MNAPIALFVYNRLNHTQRTITALQQNSLAQESELYIFSDGPKDEAGVEKVETIRKYLKTISGFKSVHIKERPENWGLAKSIIEGATEIVGQFGKIIVLEDDIVTSPHFLKYLNEALDLYQNEEKVISVHGYIYPVKQVLPETFFLRGADCWGWATWQRGWRLFQPDGKKLLSELEDSGLVREFNFDNNYNFSGMLKRQIAGLNDSWAVRWYASAFLQNKLTLYPGRSLVQNIGFDGSGVHSKNYNPYEVKIAAQQILVQKQPITENRQCRRIVGRYFHSLKPTLWQRLRRKIGWKTKI